MKVAIVIPCYKVKSQILEVIKEIGPEVEKIFVIDDKCPEQSGEFVEQNCQDPRVKVIYSQINKGVGGAVIEGYRNVIKDGYDIAVKVDGDGQMDPKLVPQFVMPIKEGEADYTKGNRFFFLDQIGRMPKTRLIGNAALSFINKAVSGYWNVMDPTNGFTAVSKDVLKLLPLDKLNERYFFESDMLFRLNTIRAVVKDIPMHAKYEDERSNMRILNVLLSFPRLYAIRLLKRIFYNYFLRDFNLGSVSLVLSNIFLIFGSSYGLYYWIMALKTDQPTPIGTVVLSALTLIFGLQLFILFLQIDHASISDKPLTRVRRYVRPRSDENL